VQHIMQPTPVVELRGVFLVKLLRPRPIGDESLGHLARHVPIEKGGGYAVARGALGVH